MNLFTPWRALALSLMLSLVLAACGGGEPEATKRALSAASHAAAVNAAAPSAPTEPLIATFPGRGEFKGATALKTVSLAEISAAVAEPGVRVAGVTPLYAVQTWRIRYLTLDAAGALIEASGLMAVPIKPVGAKSPLLSYQHGTIFKDAEAPSNAALPGEAPIVLASLGYLVVAADYVGYGVSKGAHHPYLQAEPTASAVVDLLTAARLWRQGQGRPSNGQLFLVGYSEGGYATAAAHRALTASASPHGAQLQASVAGGGPQDVGVTLDRLLAVVKDKNRLLGALINPGFLRHLGSTVREEVRRAMLREILPDDTDVAFSTTFLDFFLADDVANIDRHCNVLDWAPQVPMRLFHGEQDRTVTYLSSRNALQHALAAGAQPDLVSLTNCTASPSDHLPCAAEFFRRSTAYLQTLARDL